MVYRFRVILDNDTEEDIFRDLEIRETDTLEDLHNIITQSFGFDGTEMASFYLSNDEWDQGEEISLFDLSEDASARLILERGTCKVDDGYVWRHDERLKGRSAVKLTAAQNKVLYADLEADTLFIVAKESMGRMPGIAEFVATNEKVTMVPIDGNHHFHMEEPAPEVAMTIVNFLSDSAE